ncbi:hypothetical protein PR202_ga18932 [Eleusine coracana subsp. coracana]|uniref:Uncharacterized protein n=1 Tax=Eleusine coracana subsp. coracana TaxID=191504 RepID=A0AAV5CT52_ELECO|nr:hypothetical protein PR202_ga18932 [Eleusine coracana subsp. coracana]
MCSRTLSGKALMLSRPVATRAFLLLSNGGILSNSWAASTLREEKQPDIQQRVSSNLGKRKAQMFAARADQLT